MYYQQHARCRTWRNATATAAGMLLGEYGGKIISIGIIVSIFGCLNGKILTFPRIPMSMAERGQLPFAKFIAKESQDLKHQQMRLLLKSF